MKKELIEYVVEKSHEMMDVPYCYPGAKTAAQAWLAALGTAQAGTETKKYLAELKAAVMPIDGVLAFASSEAAVEHLGKKRQLLCWPMPSRARRKVPYTVIVPPVQRHWQSWKRKANCCNRIFSINLLVLFLTMEVIRKNVVEYAVFE